MTVEALGEHTRSLQLSRGEIEYADLGAGRPIVLLHGLALHAEFWRKVAPALAEDYRCIVPTLPLGGHRRPMPADADLSPTGIAALVAELLERLDLHDAVLVSNDTATAYTQILVTRQPERVGALVLTSGDAFRHFLPWRVRYLQAAAWLPGAARATAVALQRPAFRRSALGFGPLTSAGIPDDVSGSYVRGLAEHPGVRRDLGKVLRSISARYTLAAARQLPSFDKPALVVWARDDVLFPRRHAHRLAELLPQARVEVVADSRTYLPEDQPLRLVALIRDFLVTRAVPATERPGPTLLG